LSQDTERLQSGKSVFSDVIIQMTFFQGRNSGFPVGSMCWRDCLYSTDFNAGAFAVDGSEETDRRKIA
jgi:hypothetical protein